MRKCWKYVIAREMLNIYVCIARRTQFVIIYLDSCGLLRIPHTRAHTRTPDIFINQIVIFFFLLFRMSKRALRCAKHGLGMGFDLAAFDMTTRKKLLDRKCFDEIYRSTGIGHHPQPLKSIPNTTHVFAWIRLLEKCWVKSLYST